MTTCLSLLVITLCVNIKREPHEQSMLGWASCLVAHGHSLSQSVNFYWHNIITIKTGGANLLFDKCKRYSSLMESSGSVCTSVSGSVNKGEL